MRCRHKKCPFPALLTLIGRISLQLSNHSGWLSELGRASNCWWVWLRLCSLFVWVVCFEHVPRAFQKSDGNICLNGMESKGTGIANTLIMSLAACVLIWELKVYQTRRRERRRNLGRLEQEACLPFLAGRAKSTGFLPFWTKTWQAAHLFPPQYLFHFEALSGGRIKF